MRDETGFLKEARERFKLAVEATARQSERELEDLRFQVPEEQWTEEAKRLRRGDRESMGRPMLSITKIDQPIMLVENEAKNARLGIDIHPVSEDADDDTAEVFQGIIRRIERDSNAADGRMWAFARALRGGKGAYRVGTKYDEDADPESWDQEITVDRILYQESVYFDPAATKPDWSDGRYVFVATWLPADTFKRLYPRHHLSSAGETEWTRSAQEIPDWVKFEGGEHKALVVEYWYKDITTEKQTLKVEGEEKPRIRDREQVEVYSCKISAEQIVEDPSLWPGRYIPIIPVIGRELQPYDGERRFVGMINPVKDAQRFYNFAASSLVERMQLEPKAPYVGYVGQFEGQEHKWENVNYKNYPYLEVNATTHEGKLLPKPERSEVGTQGMSVAMAALQEADQFIHGTMQAGFDPSIGRYPARERSGRAIRALQDQLETGTSNYITDFARNSMRYEGMVIMDLIPHIYDRPGRITQILGEEGEGKPVMLGQSFVIDPVSGQPIPAPPEIPGAKTYDLARGKYTVAISVGRSHQTRVQEGRAEMAQILEAQSELWPILGPSFMKYQDAPWAKEAAELLKRYREKKFPGLGSDDEEAKSPDQLQAELQAAEDRIQQMQAELAESKYKLEINAAKQQASVQTAQLKAMTDLKQTEMDSQVKLLIEEMRQRFDAFEKRLDRTHEAKETSRTQAHEATLKEADIKFGPAQGPLSTDETIR